MESNSHSATHTLHSDPSALAPTRVFISYSHDSFTLEKKILELSEALRAGGIDATIDQYCPWPQEGWPRWMERQLLESRYVLLICNETYYDRIVHRKESPSGRGVCWEATLIYNELYEGKSLSEKFIPVLLDAQDAGFIPKPLQGLPYFVIDSPKGYEDLYRRLTLQPKTIKPELGQVQRFERLDTQCPPRQSGAFPTFPVVQALDEGSLTESPNAESSTPPIPLRQPRSFFISYAHGHPDDENLARYLSSELGRAGHEVFIDVGLKVGTDWAKEIDGWLTRCDFFVVLLSERTLASEMVVSEVRKAQQFQKANGRPDILPIRVRYDGPLQYELRQRISHLQFIRWQRQEDSQTTCQALLVAAGDHRNQADLLPSLQASEEMPSRSGPDLQMAIGGPLRHEDPHYVRRSVDEVVERFAAAYGETLIFCGARQMGRSTLLCKYLSLCQSHRKTIAKVDFDSFSKADLETFPALLKRIAMVIQRSLGFTTPVPDLDSQMDLSWYLEDTVLQQAPGPLVIAFDGTEALMGMDYQESFFDLLRAWSCSRAHPASPWEDVDLALVTSDDVELTIPDPFKSPLRNLGTVISVGSFQPSHYEALNEACGHILEPHQLECLFFLLNGHPFLTMHAFSLLQHGIFDLGTLLEMADTEPGPFSDHLRSLLFALIDDDALMTELKHIIRTGESTDERLVLRLSGLGLVKRTGQQADPANALYARYFSRISQKGSQK